MEGFVNIKVKRWLRSFVTRSIAIVPSIIITFIGDKDAFNEKINVLQAIQLPFAVIPLLKFNSCQNIMKEYTIGKKSLYFLSATAFIVVILNFYVSLLKDIDFTDILT